MLVDDVAYRLKTQIKPTEKVYARLSWEGCWLPPCQKLSGTSVADEDVIETMWASALPLAVQGTDGQEVLPRRLPVLPRFDSSASEGVFDFLDFSGMYKLDQHLHELELLPTASLQSIQMLDIRQCGLQANYLCQLLVLMPSSLKELRASRNFIDKSVLECLCDSGFPLRVLDIGYSHCKDPSALNSMNPTPEPST